MNPADARIFAASARNVSPRMNFLSNRPASRGNRKNITISIPDPTIIGPPTVWYLNNAIATAPAAAISAIKNTETKLVKIIVHSRTQANETCAPGQGSDERQTGFAFQNFGVNSFDFTHHPLDAKPLFNLDLG